MGRACEVALSSLLALSCVAEPPSPPESDTDTGATEGASTGPGGDTSSSGTTGPETTEGSTTIDGASESGSTSGGSGSSAGSESGTTGDTEDEPPDEIIPPCLSLWWTVDLPSVDSVVAVAVDDAGTIHALGTTSAPGSVDAWIGAYASDGSLLWSTIIDPTLAGVPDVDEQAADLGVLSTGDLVAVVGRNDPSAEIGVLRLDPVTMDIPWFELVSTVDLEPDPGAGIWPTLLTAEPRRLAVGTGDVIVVGGKGEGELGTSYGAWVARFSAADGAIAWARGLSLGSVFLPELVGLVVDDASGIFAAATGDPAGASTFSTFRRLDLAGNVLDAFTHPSSEPPYQVGGLAVDAGGDLVMAYAEHWPVPEQVMVVERRTPGFALVSSATEGIVGAWEQPHDAVVDDADVAYVVGRQGADGAIWAFDAAGALLWSHLDAEVLQTVATMPSGGIAVGGRQAGQGRLLRFGACVP